MERKNFHISVSGAVASMALVVLAWAFAQGAVAGQGKGPMRGAGPADPPPSYRGPAPPLTALSIVKGQAAGIETGNYPPNFKLQPIQSYADLKQWLGDNAPQKAEDVVMLSDFAEKAPIILLFGSYT